MHVQTAMCWTRRDRFGPFCQLQSIGGHITCESLCVANPARPSVAVRKQHQLFSEKQRKLSTNMRDLAGLQPAYLPGPAEGVVVDAFGPWPMHLQLVTCT